MFLNICRDFIGFLDELFFFSQKALVNLKSVIFENLFAAWQGSIVFENRTSRELSAMNHWRATDWGGFRKASPGPLSETAASW